MDEYDAAETLKRAKGSLRHNIKFLEPGLEQLDTMTPGELEKFSDRVERNRLYFYESYEGVEPDDEYRSLLSRYEELVGRLEAYLHPVRKIPAGSEDAVTREDIKDKDEMVDFDNEFSFNRFYHKTTLLQLRQNPFTRQNIDINKVKYYTAQIETGGKRKRKTKKRKQVHINTRRRVVHKTRKH